jgi:hypothetical protein
MSRFSQSGLRPRFLLLADFVAEIGIPTARNGWCIFEVMPDTSWFRLSPIASAHRTRQTASLTVESLRVSNIEQRHTLGEVRLPHHRIAVASIGD